MLQIDLESFKEAKRTFEYDYIIFDLIFYLIWIGALIKKKKWNALKAGIVTGFLVYLIDAVIWWNSPAGNNYSPGTYIREYWIGGIQMPHPLAEYFWLKFGADFMMCISYSIFAFAWLWIMFENIEKRNYKEMFFFTALYFGVWMLIPFLSFLIPINDTIVYTVRHMDALLVVWITNVFIGYIFLTLIYGTNWFGSKDLKVIGYVFVIGCLESFFMEFPLFISGIRPTGILFLLYEVLFLFNQGAPYLYVLYDKILPWLGQKMKKKEMVLLVES